LHGSAPSIFHLGPQRAQFQGNGGEGLDRDGILLLAWADAIPLRVTETPDRYEVGFEIPLAGLD
jgi:hypothetical protein